MTQVHHHPANSKLWRYFNWLQEMIRRSAQDRPYQITGHRLGNQVPLPPSPC